MKHIIDNAASQISYFASSVAIVSGSWAWLGKNSAEIGALCAILGFIVGAITAYINIRYKTRK